MVLEGVHIVPGLLPTEIEGAVVVQCVLAIEDEAEHRSHFEFRDIASDGAFSYRGKFFEVTAPSMDPVRERGFYMKPYQKPHPPIGVLPTKSAVPEGFHRLLGSSLWWLAQPDVLATY